VVNQPNATGLFLGPIGGFITWLEDLVVLLSGWMIGLGLMIGLMYLFSDGQISVGASWVIGAWVVFSAMGIEGQLVGTFYRLRVAINAKNWFEAAFYLILGAVLCYVAYVAASVFTMTQAFHLSIDQALALQGINKVDWINQRIIVLIALAALSGLQRFVDPKRQPKPLTPAEIDAQIERENALARLKATQAANSGNTFRARIAGLTGQAALAKPVVAATTAPKALPAPANGADELNGSSDDHGNGGADEQDVEEEDVHGTEDEELVVVATGNGRTANGKAPRLSSSAAPRRNTPRPKASPIPGSEAYRSIVKSAINTLRADGQTRINVDSVAQHLNVAADAIRQQVLDLLEEERLARRS